MDKLKITSSSENMKFSVPHYKQQTFLDENRGNNGFDYERRSGTNPSPALRIAPLREYPAVKDALDHLAVSPFTAFEIEENGLIKGFPGLESFLIFPNPSNPDRPVVIMDNHNHAFYFWHWARSAFHLSAPLTLIHIDQHKDSRIPAEMLSADRYEDLNEIFNYTNQILNVGNFVPPAVKCGLIGEMFLIDSSASLEIFEPPDSPFILDIDLDFFAPEFDYIDKRKKLALIKKLLPQADLVTVATSPYFIDQQLAHRIIREIFTPG
jgi:hypothetical protein